MNYEYDYEQEEAAIESYIHDPETQEMVRDIEYILKQLKSYFHLFMSCELRDPGYDGDLGIDCLEDELRRIFGKDDNDGACTCLQR